MLHKCSRKSCNLPKLHYEWIWLSPLLLQDPLARDCLLAQHPVLVLAPTTGSQAEQNYLAKAGGSQLRPRSLPGLDHDVREPVDEGSPTLPANIPLELDDGGLGIEPVSSGFTSPIGRDVGLNHNDLDDLPALPSSPPLGQPMEVDVVPPVTAVLSGSDLEGPMTELKVCSDDEQGDADTDESPIVSHLKRISADPMRGIVDVDVVDQQEEIVLSETAKAAAESAKAKRGLLRSLFPRRENRKSAIPADTARDSPKSSDSSGTPCPDPALHRLIEEGKCPDPSAHLRNPSPLVLPPGLSATPEAVIGLSQYAQGPMHGAWYPPPPPFHRATATGSPMPFARTRSRPSTAEAEMHHHRQSYYSDSSGPRVPPPAVQAQRPGTRNGRPVQAMETEHFQPGWYYARETSRPAEQASPMPYSFSTAAAKVGGQSTAPDSRIRDSYRTDTLTPLAKPPSRFRKTGIGAVASNRGVNRFYGDHEHDAQPPSRRRPGTGRTRRMHENVQFRSSPPRQAQRMQSQHKRRRPREFEDENVTIAEDKEGHHPRLEKDESVMEVDEETRAAVRLSIFGPDTPEPLQGRQQGLKELSPNVTSWRKGMRQPTTKKRRPSYWDGDLEQVKNGPAARDMNRSSGVSGREALTSPPEAMVRHGGPERRVCTSPAKEEIENVEEHEGVIGFDGESVEVGLRITGEEAGSFITGREKGETGEGMEVDTSN